MQFEDDARAAPEHLESAFKKVSSELGRTEWKMTLRKMGVTNAVIEQITVKHVNDLRKQIYEGLCAWAEANHFRVNVEDLSSALERCHKSSLAEDLRRKFSTRY